MFLDAETPRKDLTFVFGDGYEKTKKTWTLPGKNANAFFKSLFESVSCNPINANSNRLRIGVFWNGSTLPAFFPVVVSFRLS